MKASEIYQDWMAFIPFHCFNSKARAVDSAYCWLNRQTGEIIDLSTTDWIVYAYIFECCQASFISRSKKAGGIVEPEHSVCGDTNAWISERLKVVSDWTVKQAIKRLLAAGIIVKTNHRTRKEDGTFEQHRHLRPASLQEWLAADVIREMTFRPHYLASRTEHDSYDYKSYKDFQEAFKGGVSDKN